MKYFSAVPAILLLKDGAIFHGKSSGRKGTTIGEICFNTGMTGYQEVFTDPSYFGQILVMTNAHIGNYGAHNNEVESDSVKISGLVTKNFTNVFSRETADQPIQDYLINNNTTGITDIDTRALVKHIRDKGAMNAIISSEGLSEKTMMMMLNKAPSMDGLELASKVSTSTAYFFGPESGQYKVAVLDLGVKKNILRCLAKRNCYLKVFPAKTQFEIMQEWQPDGYFISNGPGDPAPMDYAIETVRKIMAVNKPIFGICLGHQILAIANGAQTYKLHNGHRGLNHPVINLSTRISEITSQNHGFGVSEKIIKNGSNINVTHLNLNDRTIEGIEIIGKKAFSVQYHPEASAGPHDSKYLFDKFVAMLDEEKEMVQKRKKKLRKVLT